jgi:hypothetical protein
VPPPSTFLLRAARRKPQLANRTRGPKELRTGKEPGTGNSQESGKSSGTGKEEARERAWEPGKRRPEKELGNLKAVWHWEDSGAGRLVSGKGRMHTGIPRTTTSLLIENKREHA